jgi:hypothetical protein
MRFTSATGIAELLHIQLASASLAGLQLQDVQPPAITLPAAAC